jgi:phospholipid/cholesterol/gamma-HCH transport system permease protein
MNFATRALLELQETTLMAARAARGLLKRPRYIPETIAQMDAIGVGSLTIIILTGFFTGGVLTVQTFPTLKSYGAQSQTGYLVAVSLVRELGPVLCALMVTGRVGSAISAELGSMVVSQQIDAMRALGTDPIRKLVVPRVVAGTIMVPILTILADALGILGGAIISKFQLRVAYSVYWNNVVAGLYAEDLWMGFIKPVVLGFALVSIGCHVGLRAKGGTQGVGRATTNAVVTGSVAVLALDFFLTKLLITLMY